MRSACYAVALMAALSASWAWGAAEKESQFRFAILGDRTGEAIPGVFEEALKEAGREAPEFLINVGDLIQGYNDADLDGEWKRAKQRLAPYRRYRFFLVPGNHDVWSDASAPAFTRNTGCPLHYGFDYQQAHFTVLDNSREDELKDEEIAFLERDLEAHKAKPVKFIFFHRPSWLFKVVLHDPLFRLHELARRYGVQYVVSGHIHQMLWLQLEGVNYLSMVSSGGHLREQNAYQRGWFFGYGLVAVAGNGIEVQIKELQPPFGKGRITKAQDWGLLRELTKQ